MGFPSSPSNGQSVIVNGVTYTYFSATNSWKRSQTPITAPISANIVYANVFAYRSNSVSILSDVFAAVDGANAAMSAANTIQSNQIAALISQAYTNSNVDAHLSSSGAGNITISSGAFGLTATGPGATTVGSATAIPVITTDAYGRIVELTSASVSSTLNTAGTTGTGSVALTNQSLTFAGELGVTANASGQTITISTPQDLRTNADPTFNSATFATDITVYGNVNATYLNTIGAEQLIVDSSLVYLESSGVYPYNFDIGMYGHFKGGPANVYGHTGGVRSYEHGWWGFFSNVKTEPTTVIDWNNAGLIWDAVKVGDSIVANTTAATSTTTGALRVAGGAGIAGNVYTDKVYTTGLHWSSNGNVMASGITYTASLTAPTGGIKGDQWYNTATDVLYEYIDDGTSSYWLDTVTPIVSAVNGNSTTLGNLTITGTLAAGGPVTVGDTTSTGNIVTIGSVNAEGISSNSYVATPYAVTSSWKTYANIASAPTLVDTFSTYLLRSAKYQIQVTAVDGFQVSEINLVHNGVDPYFAEYGNVFSNIRIGTYSANITSTNVNLYITSTNANTEIKVYRQALANDNIPVPGDLSTGTGSLDAILASGQLDLMDNG